MIEIEIDGQKVEVAENSTVMDAAEKLKIEIPHFCYHKKLSIAANCRMCLVQVEKAPKPLPACATPVAQGMKVSTRSDQALKAQKGVMEFLLINHPLDCPICDQGGECQLQDLAVGYGETSSRFEESKRVVDTKGLGPLVSAEEMSRCIHCTRCIRFGQEIAGSMELGMIGRGEHAEIVSFLGSTVNSELSGNLIDVCPVGALTSKPFRYSARTWELIRRKSVSPHDSLGSNLVLQVKQDQVMRVLPFENQSINECWLSDRDRFSYEGLNSDERLTSPMIRENDGWREVDWSEALSVIVEKFRELILKYGASEIGMLASPQSTLEEFYLTKKLADGLGIENIDFRLRQTDFSDDKIMSIPWLGMNIDEISNCDRILLVGCNVRKEQPLIGHRIRSAVKSGCELSVINAIDEDLFTVIHAKSIVPPSEIPLSLVKVINSLVKITDETPISGIENIESDKTSDSIAKSLLQGNRVGLFLGDIGDHHPNRSVIFGLLNKIAEFVDAKFGCFGEGPNALGGYLTEFQPPISSGFNAKKMLQKPRKAYFIMHAEIDMDFSDSKLALDAAGSADFNVFLGSFMGKGMEHADVILPISPFSETPGTFVNMEGRKQEFNAAVSPMKLSKPGWRVLRVLGNLFELQGFEFKNIDDVRKEIERRVGDIEDRLSKKEISEMEFETPPISKGIERLGDIPLYRKDSIVRRASSLQKTEESKDLSVIGLPGALVEALGLVGDEKVSLVGSEEVLNFGFVQDDRLPPNVVRLPGAVEQNIGVGPLYGELHLKKSVQKVGQE